MLGQRTEWQKKTKVNWTRQYECEAKCNLSCKELSVEQHEHYYDIEITGRSEDVNKYYLQQWGQKIILSRHLRPYGTLCVLLGENSDLQPLPLYI